MTIQTGVVLTTALLFAVVTNAQRRSARNSPPAQTLPTISTPGPTYNGLPLIIDSSAIQDSGTPKSQRPVSSFAPRAEVKRIPLDLEPLRWDDALYSEKVWRELDLREKINEPFRYDNVDDNGSQLFVNMLLKVVRNGQVQAFKDDRFSLPVTAAQVTNMCQGNLDTVPRYNPSTMVPDAYIVTRTSLDPKSITKLLIMEEWVFDSRGSRLPVGFLALHR